MKREYKIALILFLAMVEGDIFAMPLSEGSSEQRVAQESILVETESENYFKAVEIRRNGKIYFENKEHSLIEFTTLLKTLRNSDKKGKILLCADGDLMYGTVINVLRELRKAGFSNVSLLTTTDIYNKRTPHKHKHKHKHKPKPKPIKRKDLSYLANDIRRGNNSRSSGNSYNTGAATASNFYGQVGTKLKTEWEKGRPHISSLNGKKPVVTLKFRVASNGAILYKQIVRKCGIASVDASIERLLARLTTLLPPPQGLSEFTVNMRVDE